MLRESVRESAERCVDRVVIVIVDGGRERILAWSGLLRRLLLLLAVVGLLARRDRVARGVRWSGAACRWSARVVTGARVVASGRDGVAWSRNGPVEGVPWCGARGRWWRRREEWRRGRAVVGEDGGRVAGEGEDGGRMTVVERGARGRGRGRWSSRVTCEESCEETGSERGASECGRVAVAVEETGRRGRDA